MCESEEGDRGEREEEGQRDESERERESKVRK